MDKPEEFKAEIVDGKLNIKCRTEEIRHPDGRVDVIIHAPALSVISKYAEENK